MASLACALGEQVRQRLRTHPVLARHVVNGREPLLDAAQFGGVEVEPPLVLPQRACRLVEFDARRLEHRHDRRQRRIVRGGAGQARGDLRQPRGQRVVGIGKGVDRSGGHGGQLRGMGEARLGRGNRFPLVGGHRQRREFAHLGIEQPALVSNRGRRLRRGIAAFAGRAPLAPALGDRLRQRDETAVGVDEFALRLRRGQRLVRILAMDVDQPLAQRLQLRQRRRTPVDPRAAAAVGVENPPEEHRVVVGGEGMLGQEGANRRRVGHVEFGGEFGARGAGTQLRELEAIAQQQAQRFDQDRLACAGLAAENRETGLEFDVERFDDDEISDRQQPQHHAPLC